MPTCVPIAACRPLHSSSLVNRNRAYVYLLFWDAKFRWFSGNSGVISPEGGEWLWTWAVRSNQEGTVQNSQSASGNTLWSLHFRSFSSIISMIGDYWLLYAGERYALGLMISVQEGIMPKILKRFVVLFLLPRYYSGCGDGGWCNRGNSDNGLMNYLSQSLAHWCWSLLSTP